MNTLLINSTLTVLSIDEIVANHAQAVSLVLVGLYDMHVQVTKENNSLFFKYMTDQEMDYALSDVDAGTSSQFNYHNPNWHFVSSLRIAIRDSLEG